MRKTVIYYMIINPYNKYNTYVKASYSDGSIKYWYPETRGYKSAKNKAMRANRR
jgi:hypothetical protein